MLAATLYDYVFRVLISVLEANEFRFLKFQIEMYAFRFVSFHSCKSLIIFQKFFDVSHARVVCFCFILAKEYSENSNTCSNEMIRVCVYVLGIKFSYLWEISFDV